MALVESTEDQHVSLKDGSIRVSCCYLPHHAVIKESSTTTKLRPVFDASRVTSNGKCLNDILYPGPALQNDLPSVITSWRFHRFAFSSDLQQMFRQILVHPHDAQFQRIIWRQNSSEELREYFLKTVTFGTTSAPYLAIRTVQQLAHDLGTKYPLAKNFLLDCIFVDDSYGGADTIEQALALQQELIEIFQEAGMRLRKWVANDDRLLQSVPPEDREIQLP